MTEFYAFLWKEEDGSGPTSWWTERVGSLGPTNKAGIFTRDEAAKRLERMGELARSYVDLIKIVINLSTGVMLYERADPKELL